jgi:hypothetical protein
MKIAIMQPYFLPYIGYFQLIASVDQFVIYDNIKYTKKGWINRNRILVNGADEYITLPLKKGSDFLDVDQRELADGFEEERKKIIRKVAQAYRKAPQYDVVFPLIEKILEYPENNLFRYIHHSISEVCTFLGVDTPIIISSSIAADHQLKSQERVIAICKALSATVYINPPGGVDLYSEEDFQQQNIELRFLQTGGIRYQQFDNEFISNLSILDVLMFNTVEEIRNYIQVVIPANEK